MTYEPSSTAFDLVCFTSFFFFFFESINSTKNQLERKLLLDLQTSSVELSV